MNRNTAALLVAVVVASVGLVAFAGGNPLAPGDAEGGPGDGTDAEGIDTFDSPDEFESYVQAGQRGGSGRSVGRAPAGTGQQAGSVEGDGDGGDGDAAMASRDSPEATTGSGGPGASRRVGTTNVQEATIDEPDLVKTDGQHFFVAPSEPRIRHERRVEDDDGREFPQSTIHVVDTSEPADPQTVAGINGSGRLLIVNDTLVALERGRLVGYDVSAPDDPTREWTRELNGSLVSARATGGQVYLVVASGLGRSPECPVEPVEGADLACSDLYHPDEQVPVDATYTALSVEAASGTVTDSVGFVGTRRHTTVYMSPDALYVTYTNPMDETSIMSDALLESDEVPLDVKERIREVRSYNLSRDAERTELRYTINEWLGSLPEDEREATEERLQEELESYVEDRSRAFTTTGIVRVAIGSGNESGADGGAAGGGSPVGGAGDGSLEVTAHGTVPGRPLDQFSLDEYDGRLRIATTVPSPTGESENDLYTLEASSLDRMGSVQGMAEEQRIFSARFVDETAYLVTFRRIDPFHVIDLSDPTDPVELGVKELPGVSRYLHPINDSYVLGIGEEDRQVKMVLFDVSDPSDPTIADSSVLDRGWSEVSRNHHAFTIDRRHGVFFLPADGDGLVVDYTNGSLSVERSVETDGAKRARYVGDYLYVFGQDEIVVVDEETWERTATLTLAG